MDQVRVLVIDGDPNVRSQIKNILTHYDCAVFEAANGAMGLGECLRQQPHVVFVNLDISRPPGALAMITTILEHPNNNTKFVALIPEGNTGAIEAQKAGAVEVLILPFTDEQLVVVYAKAIARPRSK